MAKKLSSKVSAKEVSVPEDGYAGIVDGIVDLLKAARRASARSVNAIMTATYWEIGRRIVECEQAGERRAEYGAEVLKRLSAALTERFGRGFSRRNLEQMRLFFLGWPEPGVEIAQTPSAKLVGAPSKAQTPSALSVADHRTAPRFPLPWSHYVRLLSVKKDEARRFYEAEAIRGGWSVRQLDLSRHRNHSSSTKRW